jgi:hypothetical protein
MPALQTETHNAGQTRVVEQAVAEAEEVAIQVSSSDIVHEHEEEQSASLEADKEGTEIWGQASTAWQNEPVVGEQREQEQEQQQEQEQEQEQELQEQELQEQQQQESTGVVPQAEVKFQVEMRDEVVNMKPIESSEWHVAAAAVSSQEVEGASWWEQGEYVIEEEEAPAAEVLEMVCPAPSQFVEMCVHILTQFLKQVEAKAEIVPWPATATVEVVVEEQEDVGTPADEEIDESAIEQMTVGEWSEWEVEASEELQGAEASESVEVAEMVAKSVVEENVAVAALDDTMQDNVEHVAEAEIIEQDTNFEVENLAGAQAAQLDDYEAPETDAMVATVSAAVVIVDEVVMVSAAEPSLVELTEVVEAVVAQTAALAPPRVDRMQLDALLQESAQSDASDVAGVVMAGLLTLFYTHKQTHTRAPSVSLSLSLSLSLCLSLSLSLSYTQSWSAPLLSASQNSFAYEHIHTHDNIR